MRVLCTLWGKCLEVVDCNISRKAAHLSKQTAWPFWLLDLSIRDSLLWEHLKEHVYAVPPRTTKDLVARLHIAGTMVDTNILIACSRECLAACCYLTWNGQESFWTSTITTRHPRFVRLIPWAIWRSWVSWKIRLWDKCCSNFKFFSKKESHYAEPVRDFCFIL
jgi:hypothetical protein